MSRSLKILDRKRTYWIMLTLIGLVLIYLAPHAAVNVDEQLHYPHAKNVVNWYFTGGEDKSCLETPVTNLKYYGQSVDNFTALINRVFSIKNEFLVRHYVGALFFWLLLFFSGLITYQLTKSYLASILTLIVMVLMPRLFGQAFGNLKDIPFATGYMAGIYMIIIYLKELPKPHWSTAVLLGLTIAFTCSVRIGGLILFAYLGLFGTLYFVLKPFELKHIVSAKPSFVRLTGQLIIIVIIGYFAGLLFWPYALQNILKNPFVSLGVMEHYSVNIRQVFNGDLLWSTQLPWYYLPKWLLISTPEVILVGILLYLVLTLKKNVYKNTTHMLFEFLLGFSFLFPIIYVILIKSNLYSGIRQLLFILPALAILTTVGFYKFFKLQINHRIKKIGYVFFLILMIFPLEHQAKTFPADYIYFNTLIGGNKNAWSNYEYDYYFHGLKKPAYRLREMVGNNNVTIASNCNLSNYFDDLPNVHYQYVRYLERSSKDWDYGLFGINYIHPYLLKNNNWQSTTVAETYYHKGNPIAVLLIRKSKDDYRGITELENGNLELAEKLLMSSLEDDPQNVWLVVQLAKTSLFLGENYNFEKYLQKGRAIYPEYEPFYLLEAQKFYNEKKYKEAFGELQELMQVNERYSVATPLLNAVKEKLIIN